MSRSLGFPLLIVSLAIISVFWMLSRVHPEAGGLFSFLMGGLLLREAAVHVRHFRNLALFLSVLRRPESIQGSVQYSRSLILGQSAVELFAFSGLFLGLFLVTGSWFLMGGAFACASTGWQHLSMGRQAAAAAAQAAGAQVQAAVAPEATPNAVECRDG